jgi:hypothetical protein
MKNLMLCCIGVFLATCLPAQSTDPTSATNFTNVTIPGSSGSWMNTSNAGSSNDVYTTFGELGSAGGYSDYLVATGFGFSIPAGYFIKGISVDAEMSDPNLRTSDYSVRILRNGAVRNEEKAVKVDFTAGDIYYNYGGSSDLWGESWTPADINNSGFGVAISVQKNDNTGLTAGRVDHIVITVYYTLGILPVDLISFNASKKNNSVVLNWNTANETKMTGYDVQRSSDGMNFTSIGTVAAKADISNQYSFTDENIQQGISYYRLRMNDIDGHFNYSKIVSLRFSTGASLELYPNPLNTGDQLHLVNPNKEKLTVWFYDISGKMVTSITTSSDIVTTEKLKGQKGTFVYRISDAANLTLESGRIVLR